MGLVVKYKYLKGDTIMEVIVASVIILILFLFFSSLLSNFYTQNPAPAKIKALYLFTDTDFDNMTANENATSIFCPDCICIDNKGFINGKPATETSVISKFRNIHIMKFSRIVKNNEVNIIFQ